MKGRRKISTFPMEKFELYARVRRTRRYLIENGLMVWSGIMYLDQLLGSAAIACVMVTVLGAVWLVS